MPLSVLNERTIDLGINPSNGFLNIISSSKLVMDDKSIYTDLTDDLFRNLLTKDLLKNDIKFFVIDNLASLTPSIDENQKKEYDPINQWLISLRHKGITTMVIHHTNKSGGQRGTSAREDNIDVSLMLLKPNDYSIRNGARFKIKFTKMRYMVDDYSLVDNIECWLKRRDDENGGNHYWDFGESSDGVMKRKVLSLLGEQGLTQANIGVEVNLSQGRISKLKKEFEREEYLAGRELTKLGKDYLRRLKDDNGF